MYMCVHVYACIHTCCMYVCMYVAMYYVFCAGGSKGKAGIPHVSQESFTHK